MDPKSPGIAYLLLGMSIFGLAGLHRFYLGRPFTGLLWLITFGLFGLGTLVDLFYVPLMTEMENRRLGFGSKSLPDPGGPGRLPALPPPSPEQAVLQAARKNDGRVTVPMAALETGLSLQKAKRVLERMCKEGHAERDVSSEGAPLYVFPGLRSNQLFDLDSV